MTLEVGSLLKALRQQKRETLRQVAGRAEELKDELPPGLGHSIGFLSKLERGMAEIPPAHLPVMAKIYAIDPLLTLACSASPVQQVVHLRPDQDLKDAPFQDPDAHGAHYGLPRFRLGSNGDLTVAFLQLQPGGRSRPDHAHPGEEIVHVDTGTVDLIFPNRPEDQWVRGMKPGEVVHFDSSATHLLQNPGVEPASLLIIRRFEHGGR